MMSDRRAQAFRYFVSMGWTPEQSAGIVANLEAESGLRPDAVGDGGAAYGIAQWHGDRQQGFAALMGKPIQGSSFEDQLAWVHAELQGSEKAAGDALRACTTAAEAGACVSMRYERPADRQGEADKRAALAERILASQIDAGGAQTAPDIPTLQPERKAAPMPALALLPLLAQFIPQVVALLKPDSANAARNSALAQLVLNTAAQAAGVIKPGESAGATQVGQTVDVMTADPAMVQKVKDAVVTEPTIQEYLGVVEIGGGIGKAREFGVATQNSERAFWYNPTFWITALFFPMMYMITYQVLFTLAGPVMMGTGVEGAPMVPTPWWSVIGFDSNTRTGLINLIVGFVFGGVCGIWFGTTVAKQRSEAGNNTQIIEDRRQ